MYSRLDTRTRARSRNTFATMNVNIKHIVFEPSFPSTKIKPTDQRYHAIHKSMNDFNHILDYLLTEIED